MVQILDQHGNPLNKAVLKAPQTAQMVQLNRHWPEHPSRGMTIRKLPRILEAAERGDLSAQADLFEDMVERDGHVFSEMAKRKNALLTLDWSVAPPENASAASSPSEKPASISGPTPASFSAAAHHITLSQMESTTALRPVLARLAHAA